MAISRVPLNIDDRGYSGSLVLPQTTQRLNAGGNVRGLLEEAARLRNAISAAQVRAINEEIRRSREQGQLQREGFLFDKNLANRKAPPTPSGREGAPQWGSAAASLLSGPRAYREPGDVQNLAQWLKFIGPEAAHRGLSQSGALLGSTRTGINEGDARPEESLPARQLFGDIPDPEVGKPRPIDIRNARGGRFDFEGPRGGELPQRFVGPRQPVRRYTDADLEALNSQEKGTLPGTLKKTGPINAHKGEVVISEDQVDEPLLHYLIRDKMKKMRSGQMDGKGTGPGRSFQRGSLSSLTTSGAPAALQRLMNPDAAVQNSKLRGMTSAGPLGHLFAGSSAGPGGNPFDVSETPMSSAPPPMMASDPGGGVGAMREMPPPVPTRRGPDFFGLKTPGMGETRSYTPTSAPKPPMPSWMAGGPGGTSFVPREGSAASRMRYGGSAGSGSTRAEMDFLRQNLGNLQAGPVQKAPGAAYKRGSLPSYQEGTEDMLKALSPEELQELDDYFAAAEGKLREQLATGGTFPGPKPRRSVAREIPEISPEDIRREDLFRNLTGEDLGGFNEFNPITSRSSIPPEREIALRPPLASRTAGGTSVGRSPRTFESVEKLRLGTGEGRMVKWAQRAEQVSKLAKENPSKFRTLLESVKSPKGKLLLLTLAGGATALTMSGDRGESEGFSDVLGTPPAAPPREEDRRGLSKELGGVSLPASPEASSGVDWKDLLGAFSPVGTGVLGALDPEGPVAQRGQEFLENPSAYQAGKSLRGYLGDTAGATLEGAGDVFKGLMGAPEEGGEGGDEVPPSSSNLREVSEPRDYLADILSDVEGETAAARKNEEDRGGLAGIRERHKDLVESAQLREGADKLWAHLQKNVNSMSDEKYKLMFAKATRLDQLAERLEKRGESQQKRLQDVRDSAEEALQRTREARMQRGVEGERYEKQIRQQEAINLREQIEQLEKALASTEPGDTKWDSFIGLLAEAHREAFELGGGTVEVDSEEFRKRTDEAYRKRFGG